MSIDDLVPDKATNKERLRLYTQKQKEEMTSLYNLSYRYDGDHGKEMRFGDFIAHIWIKGGFAQRFHETYYHKYFKQEETQ